MIRLLAVLGLAAGALAAPPAAAQVKMPIYDTHAHYSMPAWSEYGVEDIFRNFDEAGVVRALVSSSPDDGTIKLYERDKNRIVPILRPYREDIGPSNWFRDAGVLKYLADRLRMKVHKGIGELHLYDAADATSLLVRETAALAAAREIPLHVHAGAEPIEALFRIRPDIRILWGHAGLGESAATIDATMAKFPNLDAEVALRAADIAPGGTIDPKWRDMLIRYKDRFMVGTDTWVTSRWGYYPQIVEDHRTWLKQLPADVAEAIAIGNASRKFGAPPRD